MLFPDYRPRRMRQNEALRRMIRETELSASDFILPLFAVEGKDVRNPIPSMPGHYQLSVDYLVKSVRQAADQEIPAVMLFGVPDKKDPLGTRAYAKDGIVQKAVRTVKERLPDMIVITDVCLCQYTDHGHCGILDGQEHRQRRFPGSAGANRPVPRQGRRRHGGALGHDGRPRGRDPRPAGRGRLQPYPHHVLCGQVLLGVSTGRFARPPIRRPKFGDRRTYQMDPANAQEAIREATMDVEEGADIIMVKPALPYLDIICRVREEVDLPIAAYNVSGEFAMIKAAAQKGWIDGAAGHDGNIDIHQTGRRRHDPDLFCGGGGQTVEP